MEYIKLNVTCGLRRANGHKRHQCPLRKDSEGKTRCEPGSKKYHEYTIQLLKGQIKEIEDPIDIIKSEIELKKHLIEVNRSKAQEVAALEVLSQLASNIFFKVDVKRHFNKASNRHVNGFQHQL